MFIRFSHLSERKCFSWVRLSTLWPGWWHQIYRICQSLVPLPTHRYSPNILLLLLPDSIEHHQHWLVYWSSSSSLGSLAPLLSLSAACLTGSKTLCTRVTRSAPPPPSLGKVWQKDDLPPHRIHVCKVPKHSNWVVTCSTQIYRLHSVVYFD